MGRTEIFGPVFTVREQRAIRKFLFMMEQAVAAEEEKAKRMRHPDWPQWSDAIVLSATKRRKFLNFLRSQIAVAAKPKRINPKISRGRRKTLSGEW